MSEAPARPRVALTFDDGPGAWTSEILDTLAAHQARATFFLVGGVAAEKRGLVERIAAEGHEIGNHTWSHPRLASDCDDARVYDELARTNDLLADLAGTRPVRFRAPRYDVDDRVLAVAHRLGLAHTHGDVTPPDWDPRCAPVFIATMILQLVRDGAVIGLHDAVTPFTSDARLTQRATATAVARVVPELVQRGYAFATASELVASPAIEPDRDLPR